MNLVPGTEFGRYLIESRLGAGTTAVVYLARDPTLGRRVALKLLSPDLAGDPEFRSRFVAAARSAAALDHPHVLPVYEAGEQDGQLFLATRYVSGLDLGTLLAREGALSLARAALFLTQIASALDAAHSTGLVHGDVKPTNILVAPGDHAYLSDFGLARRAARFAPAAPWEQPLHVDYLAPELLTGSPVSAGSDIYALGCCFVEFVSGTPSLRGGMPVASTPQSDLPRELVSVIARALAKRPEDRYATASEFAASVTRATGPVIAAAVTALPSFAPARSRESVVSRGRATGRVARLLLASVASLVLFGTSAVAFLAYGQNRELFGALEPAASRRPSPAATSLALITLSAEELILPLSEFPFAGYTVPRDQAANGTGWVRRYRAGGAATAPFYEGTLQVWPTSDAADAYLDTWVDACPAARSTALGGSSRACVKRAAAPTLSSITLLLVVRNVSVGLVMSPSVLASDDEAETRLSELVAIGRVQRTWIDRIAPEDGSTPPRPSPVPTPRIVTLPNDQIVLPLGDFPLAGYSLGADGVNGVLWYREFISPESRLPRPNRKIALTVYVRPSVLDAELQFAGASKCDGAPGPQGVTYQRLPTTLGDQGSACLFSVPNTDVGFIAVVAIWRNVFVGVQSEVESEPVDLRIEELVAVARSQFAVIDRVAPP